MQKYRPTVKETAWALRNANCWWTPFNRYYGGRLMLVVAPSAILPEAMANPATSPTNFTVMDKKISLARTAKRRLCGSCNKAEAASTVPAANPTNRHPNTPPRM